MSSWPVVALLLYISVLLFQDHELHKKIDHEMKMRDGSMKMLAAAKHTPQQLEAAKSLHTSNCRMVAYMEYLQKRKSEHISNGSTYVTLSHKGNSVCFQSSEG